MPRGVMLGAIKVSILSVGAAAFHFIQGVELRYGTGGSGSVSLGLAAAVLGELSIPQAASDGIANVDANKDLGNDDFGLSRARLHRVSAEEQHAAVRLITAPSWRFKLGRS